MGLELAMSEAALRMLAELLAQGVAPKAAIASMRSHDPAPSNKARMGYIVRMPDFITLPSAQCLAKNLPKGRRPTRAEVETAIAKCQKAMG